MAKILFGERPVDAPEETIKRKKTGLFDFIDDLSYSKQYILESSNKSDMSTFMLNRAFGFSSETVLLANELNKLPHISKEQAYDFYFYSLPKKKRRLKWAKASKLEESKIKLLMDHFVVNRKTAIDYLDLLNDDELEVIENKYKIGGVRK